MKTLFKFFKNRANKLFTRSDILKKDIYNKLKYGWHAPKYMERIWVDPQQINYMISREEVYRVTGIHREQASGFVIDWNDIKHKYLVTDEFRTQYCLKHWKEGTSWEELGVIEHMSNSKKYGSLPRSKITERFVNLDRAFEEAKQMNRLKTRKEIDPSNFREKDGILVHIAKDGVPVFGGNGFHRLAIAKVLELDKIPACVGLVDKDSIRYLKKYRNQNNRTI